MRKSAKILEMRRILRIFAATMNNPFRILKYVLKMRRPSRVSDMEAVFDGFWLRPGYHALTFFGFIVCRTEETVSLINQAVTGRTQALGSDSTHQPADKLADSFAVMKNHEMIHLRQAQSCHNSWLLFYIRYMWYYLRALPQNRQMKNAAYLLNPFEMEAYAHQDDPDYLNDKANGTNGWRDYARQSPSERLASLKQS